MVIVNIGGGLEIDRPIFDNPDSGETHAGEKIEEKKEEPDVISDIIPPPPPEIEIPAPVITSVGRPKLVVGKTEYYYNFSSVKLESAEGSYEYALSDEINHYTSADGKFTRIKPNQTGTYNLTVKDQSTGLTSEVKVVKGFYIKTPITNKLTPDELTAMIATGDWDGNSPNLQGRMADVVKVKSSNPEYTGGSTIQEVFMSVMEGWQVSVSSMKYDCLGRVMEVQINASK